MTNLKGALHRIEETLRYGEKNFPNAHERKMFQEGETLCKAIRATYQAIPKEKIDAVFVLHTICEEVGDE